MKTYKKIKIGWIALSIAALLPISCKKQLDSEYRSNLGPEYFLTADGLQAGLNSSYATTRFFWGSEGFTSSQVAGTDEVVRGGDGGLDFHNYTNINAQNGTLQGVWDNSFVPINNLNGILEFGPQANVTEARKTQLLGEAKFLRAFYYFLLVQTFGDVPLKLKYNNAPSTEDTRTPKKDVYAAIIKDLTEAGVQLGNIQAGQSKGRASKAAALHLLAKVHLTKGWDPDAREGDGVPDFTRAYDTALILINGRATYGVDLEANFGDIFREGNEYGKESLFVADRNTDPIYSESGFNNTNAPAGGNKENRLNCYYTSFYTLNRNVNEGIPGAPNVSAQLVARDQVNGRPYRRFRPTEYTYTTFNNRSNDARYDNTFQKEWIMNLPSVQDNNVQTTTAAFTATRNGVAVTPTKGVDAAIWMPGREVTVAERQAFKGVIIAPSQYDVEWFPTMIKFMDRTKLHFNDASDRPIVLMRLGETYLIAAEAAFKANRTGDAATMINILKTRAAFRTTNTAAQNTAAAAALQITSANISLNFILEERTRELYGEMNRWLDLVRTKTLIERARLFNALASPNIREFHVLRPIPSASQLDLLTNRNQFPQNPGY
ncbi:RagB/SusD family nutrient uptake outer membrane protein [Pedobacter cryotolerans]|uniref:RagB/SusD family nutrient uptake outer membrane protein n=1 Tax=Pedobacter cryotolerans TaxID=2571270 RepID=A0A4U1BYB9_9SPHI|nr:RagB/SusD family nutrient uptake outer membrane protein [Pedobacter cryotolerans]TKB96641.1 RagB/SusD family nutrient uptake outer membrane protein [Pedobacter cryotolerans]